MTLISYSGVNIKFCFEQIKLYKCVSEVIYVKYDNLFCVLKKKVRKENGCPKCVHSTFWSLLILQFN